MSPEKLIWQVEVEPRNDDIETLRGRLRIYNMGTVHIRAEMCNRI